MTFRLPDQVPEGIRNDMLLRRGGQLRRSGASEQEILDSLLIVNESRCRPPLPLKEVRTIARSVARYEPLGDVGWVHPSVYAAPAEASLRRRGLRLYESGAVTRRSSRSYDVAGRRGGSFHVDIATDGGPACTCGRFLTPLGQRCAHVFAVRWYARTTTLPEVGDPLT